MKKNVYFVFIALSFAFLAVAPGRLAYGIPLIVELNLLLAGAGAFNSLVRKLDLGGLEEILSLACVFFLATLFKQALVFYSSVIALSLSFLVYLPAASVFLLGSVFSKPAPTTAQNLSLSLKASAFAFFFFLVRDVLGYGAISLPAPGGIAEAFLFDSYKTSFLSFFATIPGALLLLVLCMAVLLTAQSRMNVFEKSGAVDDNN